jgi:integrase
MARHRLTDKKITSTKPGAGASTVMLPDGEGLYLRIRPTGARGWVYVYDIAGQQRRMGLGTYPTVTLARARELAEEARRLRADGVDPLDARQAAAEEAATAAEKAKTDNVRALAHEWARLDLNSRRDGGANALRALEKDAFGIIGDMAPEDVRPEHVLEVVDAMKARGVTRTTSAVFAELRQLFRWATVRRRIASDPTYGLDKGKICAPSPPRRRVLTDTEIIWLADRIEAAISRRARLLFLLLLATGNRIGETLLGEWREIDFEKGEWLIPACHRKGNARHPATDHLVPLSDFCLAVLASVQADAGDSPMMWPGADAKSMTKAFTDRQTDPATATRKRRVLTTDLLPTNGHWTPHDLRRTARTLMSRLGVSREVAERCVGHAEGDRIVATYDVWEYASEKRAALGLLGEHLAGVLTPA